MTIKRRNPGQQTKELPIDRGEAGESTVPDTDPTWRDNASELTPTDAWSDEEPTFTEPRPVSANSQMRDREHVNDGPTDPEHTGLHERSEHALADRLPDDGPAPHARTSPIGPPVVGDVVGSVVIGGAIQRETDRHDLEEPLGSEPSILTEEPVEQSFSRPRRPGPTMPEVRDRQPSRNVNAAPRTLSSKQVMVLAASTTLAIVGIGLAILLWLLSGRVDRAPAPQHDIGSVVLNSSPGAACTVFIDGRPKGLLAPRSSAVFGQLTAGKHRVSVRCVGFKRFDETVSVKPGQVTMLTAALVEATK